MEFKVGQKIKINDILFTVSAFCENYALVVDMSVGIVDGGFVPVIIKIDEQTKKIVVLTEEEEVKVALQKILTNGSYI